MAIRIGRKNVTSLAYWQDSYENRYQHLNTKISGKPLLQQISESTSVRIQNSLSISEFPEPDPDPHLIEAVSKCGKYALAVSGSRYFAES